MEEVHLRVKSVGQVQCGVDDQRLGNQGCSIQLAIKGLGEHLSWRTEELVGDNADPGPVSPPQFAHLTPR